MSKSKRDKFYHSMSESDIELELGQQYGAHGASSMAFDSDSNPIEQLFGESDNISLGDRDDAHVEGEEPPDNEDNDWLEAMAQDLTEDEETGPQVPENLATLVDKMIKKRIPEEKVRVLLDKQIRPRNVEMLQNPKCNPHIWMRLKAATRRNDIRTGHIDDKITRLIIANTKTVASLALFKDKIPSTHTKDITKSVRRDSAWSGSSA